MTEAAGLGSSLPYKIFRMPKTDWTVEELRALAQDEDAMRLFLTVLHELSEIRPIEHLIIDRNADLFIPENWTVEEHKKRGQLKWPFSVELCFSKEQQKINGIRGHQLRKKLANKSVLNGCVLAFFLEHPQLIPEEWKSHYIYFWGTVYRDPNGELGVCCLYWNNGQWCCGLRWLDCNWRDRSLAALLAS